jgi:hypothetical protein
MRYQHASLRRRRTVGSLLALVAGATLGTLPVPALAQATPPVPGLQAQDAELFREQGVGVFGIGPFDQFGFSVAAGDFDGDGAEDLATGVPFNDCDFNTNLDCGSAVVRYGAPGIGLTGRIHTLTQLFPGAPDMPHAGERFGYVLAAGDFDADGNDDLAVGVPGNLGPTWYGGTGAIGGVQIHRGMAAGITLAGDTLLRQGAGGMPGEAVLGDRFGQALAVGDFDGNGHDDLAIGAPFDNHCVWRVCTVPGFGSVTVAHGKEGGLVPVAAFEMYLGLDALPHEQKPTDLFGYALAAGDFDGDGFDDLAIGVPGRDGMGAVLVVYGSTFSLLFPDHWYFTQHEIGELPELGDRFGEALVAGDFDGDGFDDLAIGAPGEDGGGGVPADMGMVAVVEGGPNGLSPAFSSVFYELDLQGPDASEAGDRFGGSLAAGDFDGDGVDDLAVGRPGERWISDDAGAATLMYGRSAHGLPGRVQQARPGSYPSWLIPDVDAGDPMYGFSLATGDFDANGFDDLAIGAPRRDTNGGPFNILDIGAVAVVYGDDGLLSPAASASAAAVELEGRAP